MIRSLELVNEVNKDNANNSDQSLDIDKNCGGPLFSSPIVHLHEEEDDSDDPKQPAPFNPSLMMLSVPGCHKNPFSPEFSRLVVSSPEQSSWELEEVSPEKSSSSSNNRSSSNSSWVQITDKSRLLD